uniref:PH domain-containing protein n=1 Tax=Guillardia theta TaxID=55529 RepID=A0A7S4PRR2_GUITH|mmetsp:Transcript_9717/g.32513  ORF Transcript_9717/g.32513 Transcript_9717/m.32513 type:complete len:533 (+) Transcript_9717:179-1777(+)
MPGFMRKLRDIHRGRPISAKLAPAEPPQEFLSSRPMSAQVPASRFKARDKNRSTAPPRKEEKIRRRRKRISSRDQLSSTLKEIRSSSPQSGTSEVSLGESVSTVQEAESMSDLDDELLDTSELAEDETEDTDSTADSQVRGGEEEKEEEATLQENDRSRIAEWEEQLRHELEIFLKKPVRNVDPTTPLGKRMRLVRVGQPLDERWEMELRARQGIEIRRLQNKSPQLAMLMRGFLWFQSFMDLRWRKQFFYVTPDCVLRCRASANQPDVPQDVELKIFNVVDMSDRLIKSEEYLVSFSTTSYKFNEFLPHHEKTFKLVTRETPQSSPQVRIFYAETLQEKQGWLQFLNDLQEKQEAKFRHDKHSHPDHSIQPSNTSSTTVTAQNFGHRPQTSPAYTSRVVHRVDPAVSASHRETLARDVLDQLAGYRSQRGDVTSGRGEDRHDCDASKDKLCRQAANSPAERREDQGRDALVAKIQQMREEQLMIKKRVQDLISHIQTPSSSPSMELYSQWLIKRNSRRSAPSRPSTGLSHV